MKQQPAFRTAVITVVAAASCAALAGCAHPDAPPPVAAAAPPGAAPGGGPPGASTVQSDIARVQADASLNPAQKQMMLNQMQHAARMGSAGR